MVVAGVDEEEVGLAGVGELAEVGEEGGEVAEVAGVVLSGVGLSVQAVAQKKVLIELTGSGHVD